MRLGGDHHHRLVVDQAGAEVPGDGFPEERLVLVELHRVLRRSSNGLLLLRVRGLARVGDGGLTVKIGPRALKESRALEAKAKRKQIASLKLTVLIKNTAGNSTTVAFQVKHPR